MSWKRRRDRWRTLPRTKRRGGYGTHWGRGAEIPDVPGGPEMSTSTSGDVQETRRWSLGKWLVVLLIGFVAAMVTFPFLFTWIAWLVLAAILVRLIYETWRR